MPRYAAFLRAVNLGGSTSVGMARWRELLAAAGYGSVATVLQSGNAVFETSAQDRARLEAALEAMIEREFGRRPVAMVRTPEELREVRAANPFVAEAREDPSHLLVLFLKGRPSPARWEELRAAITGRERVAPGARDAYLVYPDGIGRSKLTAARIDRALGTPGTARNWTTVGRVLDAAERPG